MKSGVKLNEYYSFIEMSIYEQYSLTRKKKAMPKKFERNKDSKITGLMENFLLLVEKKGFSAVKIIDIADRTGVSVGTVYRYFPEGKASMLRFILEGHFSEIADLGTFRDMDESNVDAALESMITRHIEAHRRRLPAHIAINQAILMNRELLTEYNTQLTDLFADLAPRIRAANAMLSAVPPEVFFERLLLIFDIMEAVIHRHLFIRNIKATDEELVDFLKGVIRDQVLR
jgi:AcrR family transcriptional regulator